jgi:hypothetical protein
MAIALFTLAVVGTLSLAGTMLLGYFSHGLMVKRHILMALGTTTILVMAHSFIMFFLIATGVEMKDLEKERGWGDSFRRRTVAMKGRVFPVVSLALLIVMANFILGGAAHTHALPLWVHATSAWITLAVCCRALQAEWWVLGENNRLIEEAARRRAAGN